MRILGIDPGTATTGFGVIEFTKRNEKTVLDFGVLTTSKDLNDSDRLVEVFSDLSVLITKYKPDFACVEKLFFSTNQKTVMTVAQSRGVVLLLLAQNHIPVLEFTPLQVKSMICGFGKARKDQVQRMVKQILNLKEIPKPDDASDALALAICAGQFGTRQKQY